MRRLLYGICAVGAITFMIALLASLLPVPETAVVNRARILGDVQSEIVRGNYAEALVQVEHGLAIQPNDSELIVWQLVLREKQGLPNASPLPPDTEVSEFELWLTRGIAALAVGLPNSALEAGLELLALEPNNPSGYFIAAQSYEALGSPLDAFAAYQQVIEFTEHDDTYQALYVAARERLQMLGLFAN